MGEMFMGEHMNAAVIIDIVLKFCYIKITN